MDQSRRTQALPSVSGDAALNLARATETANTKPTERSELTFALTREVEARTRELDNRVIEVEQAVKALDIAVGRRLARLNWVMMIGVAIMLLAFAGGAVWVRAQFVHQIAAITEQSSAIVNQTKVIDGQVRRITALWSEFNAFKARVKNVCRGGHEDPATGNWVETCEKVIEPASCSSVSSIGSAP